MEHDSIVFKGLRLPSGIIASVQQYCEQRRAQLGEAKLSENAAFIEVLKAGLQTLQPHNQAVSALTPAAQEQTTCQDGQEGMQNLPPVVQVGSTPVEQPERSQSKPKRARKAKDATSVMVACPKPHYERKGRVPKVVMFPEGGKCPACRVAASTKAWVAANGHPGKKGNAQEAGQAVAV